MQRPPPRITWGNGRGLPWPWAGCCSQRPRLMFRRKALVAMAVVLATLGIWTALHESTRLQIRIRIRNSSRSIDDGSADIVQIGTGETGAATYLDKQKLSDALARDVVVRIASRHFFNDDYSRDVPGCAWRGYNITCRFVTGWPTRAAWKLGRMAVTGPHADAVWYHAPNSCRFTNIGREDPEQLAVVMSMESAQYYPCLDNAEFMARFDLEMTYRLQSQVPVPYIRSEQVHRWMDARPIPFEGRIPAIAYIQSNCNSIGKRESIMQTLIELANGTALSVHAMGRCLHNVKGDVKDKIKKYREYRFCVTMEISRSRDYVTEKLYDAFEGGCLPIYFGAPNIADFLPHAESIIDYQKLGSPEACLLSCFGSMPTRTNGEAVWPGERAPSTICSRDTGGWLNCLRANTRNVASVV